MTRPVHEWRSADIAAYIRDPSHRTGDGRSEDALPRLRSQAELDRIPVGDMHQADEPETLDSFAMALGGVILAGLILGGAVVAWVTL